jgi:hypothetical protein
LESEILKVQGMATTLKFGAKKPCDDECTVLGLQADIEYADGKKASNAQGVRGPIPVMTPTKSLT